MCSVVTKALWLGFRNVSQELCTHTHTGYAMASFSHTPVYCTHTPTGEGVIGECMEWDERQRPHEWSWMGKNYAHYKPCMLVIPLMDICFRVLLRPEWEQENFKEDFVHFIGIFLFVLILTYNISGTKVSKVHYFPVSGHFEGYLAYHPVVTHAHGQ